MIYIKENFNFVKTKINDLFIIENNSNINYDKEIFFQSGIVIDFIQDNESFSKKNVLRGLHIQLDKPQTKLVKVLDGEIFDVAVDLRENSKTFGKWFGINLSSSNNKMLYIPEGFAHGFLVLSDYAKITFKVSNKWNATGEIGIPWNDSTLNIEWPLNGNTPILSEKDKYYLELKENKIFSKHFSGGL